MAEKILMAVLTQSGEGCDYTIGCCVRVEKHNPSKCNEAKFVNDLMEDYCGDERGITIEFFRAEPIKAKKVETVTSWGLEQ